MALNNCGASNGLRFNGGGFGCLNDGLIIFSNDNSLVAGDEDPLHIRVDVNNPCPITNANQRAGFKRQNGIGERHAKETGDFHGIDF